MKQHFFLFLACLSLSTALELQAKQPYHTTVSINQESATVSAPNLVDLKRNLTTTGIQELFPFYTSNAPTSFNFNIRGITALAVFPANSPTLVVQIPQTGTTQTFEGATRDASLTLFKDFLREGGSRHRIFKAYAKYSPIDPLAGNPNSLLAQMAEADYQVGTLSPLSGCDPCWTAQPIETQYQLGLNAGRAFAKSFDTTAITLPLRYSFSPDLNRAFIIDAPLTYLRNGGASSLAGSLGIGMRTPITHQWSLTPIVRLGFGGSLDLCTSGSFVSAGLTSVYQYKIGSFVLAMTNYAGYFTSTNLWLTGINFTYHLHNVIFKNGIAVTTCKNVSLWNREVHFRIAFEDSCFTKDRLFIQHYDEINFSLIGKDIFSSYYDCLSLKFAYQFGENNYRGYFLNLAYQF